MADARIIVGDCRDGLATLEAGSVHACITSPPYWGLRDYGHDGQMGLEQTPEEYVAGMVDVFRAVARVLRPDGTLWLNLGDSYAGGGTVGRNDTGPAALERRARKYGTGTGSGSAVGPQGTRPRVGNLKSKDLVGIPWRVAFALQADGWYLRSDIIWAKPNPMPESVTDRPTKAHEYLFLLAHPDSKGRYYYDADAVKEDASRAASGNIQRRFEQNVDGDSGIGHSIPRRGVTRNKRTVWAIPSQPFPGAHFAVMPPALVIPCVKAGTSERGSCAECGAPFMRVVERSGQVPIEDNQGDDLSALRKTNNDADRRRALSGARQAAWKAANPDRFIGWARSCDHDGDPVPCTVLDPFAGAGTVGVVATGHGRRFIGCELSGEYAALAEARIANPAANLRAPVADPRQGVLFG